MYHRCKGALFKNICLGPQMHPNHQCIKSLKIDSV